MNSASILIDSLSLKGWMVGTEYSTNQHAWGINYQISLPMRCRGCCRATTRSCCAAVQPARAIGAHGNQLLKNIRSCGDVYSCVHVYSSTSLGSVCEILGCFTQCLGQCAVTPQHHWLRLTVGAYGNHVVSRIPTNIVGRMALHVSERRSLG